MTKVELRNQGTSSTDSTDTAGTQTVLPNYRSRNKGNEIKLDTIHIYFLYCLLKIK